MTFALSLKCIFTSLWQGFREGNYQVLVATDVAARGLDIPEVDLVVQCEPPKVRVHGWWWGGSFR